MKDCLNEKYLAYKDLKTFCENRKAVYMDEEQMVGKPITLKRVIIPTLVTQLQILLTTNNSDYENICEDLRQMADVLEEIENHINDESIRFEYNPMGAWVRVEGEEFDF